MQGETNYKWAREAAKWGADFMAKSVEESRVLLHIGDIKKDHNYLGRAEVYPQIDRNILFCNSGAPSCHTRPAKPGDVSCLRCRTRILPVARPRAG